MSTKCIAFSNNDVIWYGPQFMRMRRSPDVRHLSDELLQPAFHTASAPLLHG